MPQLRELGDLHILGVPVGRTLGRQGVSRPGSIMDNGSGDYVIAFSTHPRVRRTVGAGRNVVEALPVDEVLGILRVRRAIR